MSDTRRVTQADITRVRELATRNIMKFAKEARLPHMLREMNQAEILALAYIDACLTVFNVTDVIVYTETPDSEVLE